MRKIFLLLIVYSYAAAMAGYETLIHPGAVQNVDLYNEQMVRNHHILLQVGEGTATIRLFDGNNWHDHILNVPDDLTIGDLVQHVTSRQHFIEVDWRFIGRVFGVMANALFGAIAGNTFGNAINNLLPLNQNFAIILQQLQNSFKSGGYLTYLSRVVFALKSNDVMFANILQGLPNVNFTYIVLHITLPKRVSKNAFEVSLNSNETPANIGFYRSFRDLIVATFGDIPGKTVVSYTSCPVF